LTSADAEKLPELSFLEKLVELAVATDVVGTNENLRDGARTLRDTPLHFGALCLIDIDTVLGRRHSETSEEHLCLHAKVAGYLGVHRHGVHERTPVVELVALYRVTESCQSLSTASKLQRNHRKTAHNGEKPNSLRPGTVVHAAITDEECSRNNSK
jgi:hypothetical protein